MSTPVSSERMSLGATPWQIGVRAARANLVPGLVLQAAAVAFVAGEDGAGGFHAVLLGVDGCDTRMNALPAREAKRFLLGFPFRSNHAIR